jgi:hypothetical protein
MRKTTGILIAILFFFSIANAEETQYTNNSFARVSYVKGDIYVQRAAELGYEEGVVNMPISEGDRMSTADGQAEIYLGNGNYVRLDNETKIDFLILPKTESELIRIRVWTGNIYFRVRDLKEEKNIEIHTPDVSAYLLDNGLYRIDVRQGNETEIFVFEGMLEAAGESDSILVNNEQRIEVSAGRFTSQPTRFFAVAEDSFDRWSEHRDSEIGKRMAKAYLPEELEDFEYELSAHGDWVYMAPFGHVWVPGGIDPYWRPYYYGRWTWLPLCGWTWIPYETWGWCTYHYGRWQWRYGLGWYWIPTRVWGPAWVSWYWGYDYFGWAPLSYYGYPGVIINNMYYGRFRGSQYPYNSRALTVIHKNQLKARNVSKVALSQSSVKSLGNINLTREKPPIKPAAGEISVERLDGKKVLLRKNGTSPESKVIERERLSGTTARKTGAVDSSRAGKEPAVRAYPSQERKVVKKKSDDAGKTRVENQSYKSRSSIKKDDYANTPSRKVSAAQPSKKIIPKKSSSFIGRIYKKISGSSKSVKTSSSQGTSSKRVSSSSRSRSSSGASRRSSSSSSRSASNSGKVKKKN